jgi:hypothetical protein
MGVMLGMTTAATFIACGGPVGEISDAIDENSSSSNEIQAPKSDSSSPESSNQAEVQQSSSEQSEAQQNSAEQTGAQQSGQEQTKTKQSSSSQVVVDIPLSHEPISSSVMEALSAAAESSSSSTPSDKLFLKPYQIRRRPRNGHNMPANVSFNRPLQMRSGRHHCRIPN